MIEKNKHDNLSKDDNMIRRSKIYFYFRRFLKTIYRKFKTKGTGRKIDARYYYSAYMRHIVCLYECGMTHIPKRVVELGPGDTLGMGICSLLMGTDEYFAFDIKKHTNVNTNLKILDDLVLLFKNKSDIPNDNEFPGVKPVLNSYSFPEHIFNDEHLQKFLTDDRINNIRQALQKNQEKTKKFLVLN